MNIDDEFIHLEDLKDIQTRNFIIRHNKRFREFIGSMPDLFYNRIRKYYGVMHVVSYKITEKGIYALTRDSRGYKVSLIYWNHDISTILSSNDIGDDVVISGVYPHPYRNILGIFYTRSGSDIGKLVLMEEDKKSFIDELDGSIWSLIWINDEEYYFTRFYREGVSPDGVPAPASRVFRRDLDGDEEMVFGGGLESNYIIGLMDVRRENWMYAVVSYGWQKSKVYGGKLDDPDDWRLVLDGGENIVLPISYHDGSSYLIMYDGGGLGRVVKTVDGEVEELVPEYSYPLKGGEIVGNMLFLNYLVDASSKIRRYDLDGNFNGEVKFNEPTNILSIEHYDGKTLLLMQSFSRPPYLAYLTDDLDVNPLYGYDPEIDLKVSDGWVESEDGVKIHYFRVEMDRPKNGVAIIYGYGGFGISMTPGYIGYLIPFLEDGGIFVVANLRGGSEYGEEWHRMGMKENKLNVFKDFASVANHFKRQGFKTVCWGSSNGGLLVAATMCKYPHTMDVALIGYPVLDMLRFHKLFIGRLWTTEYGDPDNPKDREYLVKYSPYHNIEPNKDYPSILVYTGINDDRVHPGHALKFVAKLEKLGYKPFLRVETRSGHMGASPDVKAGEYSDIYAFIYKVLNIRG